MSPTTPDVSIVILNWNSYPLVLEAAASAAAQIDVATELVIVDNGSNDGSLLLLRRQFPRARFLEIGFNSGFTGGMNAGTDVAQGEYVLWQNADLVLAEDYCSRAIDVMRSDSTIGALGGLVCRLVNGQRTEVVDAAGYTITSAHRARPLATHVERDVVGVSGSCPLFRRGALEDLRRTVGYVLDPWYFTYGEDIDVMLRLNLRGWKVRYRPTCRAWHVRSGSTVAGSRFFDKPSDTQVHHFKNRLATVVKTLPTGVLLRRLVVLLSIEVLLPAYLMVRRPRSLKSWALAWARVLSESGRLLRDRRAIKRTAAVGAAAHLRRLLGHKW